MCTGCILEYTIREWERVFTSFSWYSNQQGVYIYIERYKGVWTGGSSTNNKGVSRYYYRCMKLRKFYDFNKIPSYKITSLLVPAHQRSMPIHARLSHGLFKFRINYTIQNIPPHFLAAGILNSVSLCGLYVTERKSLGDNNN